MKNSEYWKKRFVEMEEATHQTSVKKIFNIQEQFDKSAKVINEKINSWYQRYAENNNMSMLDAKKSLNAKELKELKWDVEEYIKKGRENAFSGEWVKELENASAKAHISRLEALELQCRQQAEVAFGNLNDEVSNHIKDVYKEGYYRTAYEIQKGVGVGSNFAALNDKLIEKVINKPWLADGKNFSDRIWGNKNQLINQLHTSLSHMCITGSGPDKAINEIASKMNVSKANAGRLVMTETAYFSSAAKKECFKELDVERYEIVATLDGHTSDICQEMDGKVFKMSEYEEGVTAPPFHVNCRSCTAPYFDDEWGENGERAVRDEDGDTYYVPADMTYGEWRNKIEEFEFSRKHPENMKIEETLVNFNYNSREFYKKIEKLSKEKEEVGNVFRASKEILEHRNGTNFEDLCYIKSGTEKRIINKSYDYYDEINKVSACKANSKMKSLLRNSKQYTIIAVHNHPRNSAPSVADIFTACNNKYKYGVVICHNCNIYKYKIISRIKKENYYFLEMCLADLERNVYNYNKEGIMYDIDRLATIGVYMEVF